ncbi:type II toxin-antitoxin system RelE/ParE family toxin [Leifsonia sp. NPDC058248]|uniref:type II toxin-antitoxin system RelE/ParE family toxin n=1 Tax=Leifsonia sp. NPDC058248 TaxID=3346402 RepID=UPI0036D90813
MRERGWTRSTQSRVALVTLDVNNAPRSYLRVLQSFADDDTEHVWHDRRARRFSTDLIDCRVPPGNRLEKLSGNRQGQFSIRTNDQFRICFEWTTGGPENVHIVDYR